MSDKIFVKQTLLIMAFIYVSIYAFNYFIDPYGKNREFINSINKQKLIADQRYDKFELLKKYPDSESFLVGSSRVLRADPIYVKSLTDTNTINLAFSSATPDEYALYIDYILQNYNVKRILLGIDLYAFTDGFQSNGAIPFELLDQFNQSHPFLLRHYTSYKTCAKSLKTIRYNLSGNDYPSYTSRGKMITKEFDEIKSDEKKYNKYLKENIMDASAKWDAKSDTLSIEKLNILYDIALKCKNKKVQLNLFMNPVYIKQIKMKDSKFYLQQELLKYIANNISPIWDYNGISSLNSDPRNFEDRFHYTAEVSNKMMFQMINNSSESYEGKLITPDNVLKYINDVNKKLKSL